jgi:4-amino-4-deoxy-L-arabinose transferase-like glycosyltransferase
MDSSVHTSQWAPWVKQYLPMFLVAIAVIGLVIASTYRLNESPGIWEDEGYYTQAAMNLAQYGRQELQVAPGEYVSTAHVTVGYPLLYPVSVAYRLFGVGVTQGRAVMVLFILGFAVLSYVLIRKLFGSWYAAWTLLLLASFPMLYGDGKSVLGEVPGLFYLVLTLISLLYLERSRYRSLFWYALTGLAAGLCAATKPIFLLLLGALCLTLIIRWRRVTLEWKGVLLGAVTLALPLLLWIHMQFGASDMAGTALSYYSNPYGITNLAGNALANFLEFFTQTTPIYTTLIVLAWGCALYLRRKAAEISSAELAGFIFCLLILLAYLRLEDFYRYFFPATMVAILFFPLACSTIFAWLQKHLVFLRDLEWLLYAALALLILAQAYQTAFSSYAAQYYDSTRTSDAAAALTALPTGASVFFYNVPEVVILFHSNNYYQYLEPSAGSIIGADQLAALQDGTPDFVVIGPDVYSPQSTLFSKYVPLEDVNKYLILKRES